VTLFVGQAGTTKRKRGSQLAGFAAVAIAAAALIGEWAGLPLLSSWGSGFATVKPVSALCLMGLGLALVHPGENSRFGLAIGLAVAALAVLDLFGVDFGINRWLAPRAAVRGPAASFPMMNGMQLALALAGGSLALSRFERHHFTATVLGGLAGIMAVFAVLTYLTGIHALYGLVSWPALPTAVGLLCVAVSFCESERCPLSAMRDRYGSCRLWSVARSLRRSYCSALTRERALPSLSSALFKMT
jgi:hypothetical protein